MWIKLISEGIQRNGIKITRRELEDAIKNFKQPVPITVGHVFSDKAPAVGFVEELKLKEDGLYGKVNLSPVGKWLVENNYYRNVSASFRRKPDGTWYLHHVALLGAVPPAGEDAQPIQIVEFSNAEDEESIEVEVSFADTRYKSFARTDYPVCLDCEWDADEAKKRIVEKFGWEKLAQCVGAVEVEEDGKLPESFSRYKFPYCDVVDGEIRIIAKAVSSGLAYLNGAMGVKVDPELEKIVRPVFEKLKKRIEEEKQKQKKEMSDKGGINMKELQQRLKALEERLAKEKLERLKEVSQKKFSDELTKEILEFANSLPMDFSQEETYIDKLIRILEKIPSPVSEGEKEFSNLEENEDLSKALRAF